MSVLAIRDLHAGYGETEILHGLNILVDPGEIVVVVGPNGAGKSTAMKSVLGLLNIRSGRIELEGTDITGTPPTDVITKGVSYVPQTHNVFVSLSVQENLEMGAWTSRQRGCRPSTVARSSRRSCASMHRACR